MGKFRGNFGQLTDAPPIHDLPPYYIYVLRVPIFDIFFRKIFRVSLIFFPSFPEFFDNPLYTLPASALRYAKFLCGVPV